AADALNLDSRKRLHRRAPVFLREMLDLSHGGARRTARGLRTRIIHLPVRREAQPPRLVASLIERRPQFVASRLQLPHAILLTNEVKSSRAQQHHRGQRRQHRSPFGKRQPRSDPQGPWNPLANQRQPVPPPPFALIETILQKLHSGVQIAFERYSLPV